MGLIAQAIGTGKLSASERIDKLSLVNFTIAHFNVREEEMLVVHAPLTTLTILAMLGDAKVGVNSSSEDVSQLALSTAMELVELIPERAFQTRPSTSQSIATTHDGEASRTLSNAEILQAIKVRLTVCHFILNIQGPSSWVVSS